MSSDLVCAIVAGVDDFKCGKRFLNFESRCFENLMTKIFYSFSSGYLYKEMRVRVLVMRVLRIQSLVIDEQSLIDFRI